VRWVALVVLFGCTHPVAPKPTPKPWIPDDTGEPSRMRGVMFRPPFRVAFLIDGLTPPLTHVPGETPSFPLTPLWPEICDHRGSLPADVLEYALAWCGARSGDHRELVARLHASFASTVPRLADAAVEDLANLALDTETVAEVIAGLPQRDAEMLDYLAALYLERERDDDALAVLDYQPGWPASRERRCRRAVIRTMTQLDRESAAALLGFADTRCLQHLSVLRCTVARVVIPADTIVIRDLDAASMCPDGSVLPEADVRAVRLAEAYVRWDDARPPTWLAVADAATAAIDEISGAGELAVTILERMPHGGCVRDVAPRVAALLGHDPALDKRLDKLACHGT
jgi:hypothetical protein